MRVTPVTCIQDQGVQISVWLARATNYASWMGKKESIEELSLSKHSKTVFEFKFNVKWVKPVTGMKSLLF